MYVRINNNYKGHRGIPKHVYKVIDQDSGGFRLKQNTTDQYTFWVSKSECEEVEPGAASIPSWAGSSTGYIPMGIKSNDSQEAEKRKKTPVFTGVLRYFPDAVKELSRVSLAGNTQHHPDKPLHWDRSKSGDELDALARHLIDAGKLDTDGIRHSAKVAWRALANLQKELEEKGH